LATCKTDAPFKKHVDIVLGHEGVGIVEATGPLVQNLKKGDRVGWGYETDACGLCESCFRGEETFCPKRSMYGGDPSTFDQGSFSSQAIWREAFLHPIPDGMSDETAAPLQCGGATVFSPLMDAKSTDTVGVLGVGGLGHLAIQFANKMGCRVVVLSGSSSKKEQAMQLGAHKFIAMKDGDPKLEGVWKLNRLLVTASNQPDWAKLLPLMAPNSTVYPLSVVPGENLSIPYMPVMLSGISVSGSLVATRHVHRDMLAFAALHGIRPIVEKFPMTEEGIKSAMDRLDKGQVQYRAVLIPE
jgi:D-arabinose 1-dehydrogenase-like Zn-dependent alcohol dehydrogenase